jgi:hypothetical protein
MNNKPVAYVDPYDLERLTHYDCHIGSQKMKNGIPLYTHPHPDNLGLAESIIKQQQLEIEALKVGKIRAYENGYEDGRKPDTNPVKELTDEEIMELWYPLDLHDEAWVEDSVLVNFARAILRKAQEK